MKNLIKNNTIMAFVALVSLLVLLVSCGSYAYYDDGIYGERQPERPVMQVVENQPHRYYNDNRPNRYSDYFKDKAAQYENYEPTYTPLTDVEAYKTDPNTTKGEHYAGWGQNSSQVTVNIYDNNWNYPYYGYRNYWGYDNFWGYPYYRNPYYRSGFSWGISVGYGDFYEPWGWGRRYYDPYWGYGYYSGFYPYYGYDYYYSYHRPYYYYGGNYYGYNGKTYAPAVGRRGDENRYDSRNYGNQRADVPYSQQRNPYPNTRREVQQNNNRYEQPREVYRYNQGRNDVYQPSTGRNNYQTPNNNSGRSYDSGNYGRGSSGSERSSGGSGSGTSVGRRG